MKTKAERQARRKKILKGVARGVGSVVGLGLDILPLPGVSKLIPNIIKPLIPQLDLDADLNQDNYLNDVVPLIRSIKTLRAVIERILTKLGII